MHLEEHLNTLEAKDTLTGRDRLTVERLSKKIEALDVDFKEHHYAVIDLVGDDEQKLDEEQALMDDNEDKVAEIVVCLQQLQTDSKVASLTVHSMHKCVHLGKWLCRMEIGLRKFNGAVEPLVPGPGLDNCLTQQFEEHITSLKAKLEDIAQAALLFEDEGRLEQHAMLEQALYNLDLKVKQVLHAYKSKLRRIDVTMFNRNILQWTTFWEQFEASVHCKTQLTNVEKLAYLRHALKDGPAVQAIEGLSQSANQYEVGVSNGVTADLA